MKFRNLVENVEIKTLEVAKKGKEFVIDTKDKVVDFATTQAANYYLRQEEKEQEAQVPGFLLHGSDGPRKGRQAR